MRRPSSGRVRRASGTHREAGCSAARYAPSTHRTSPVPIRPRWVAPPGICTFVSSLGQKRFSSSLLTIDPSPQATRRIGFLNSGDVTLGSGRGRRWTRACLRGRNRSRHGGRVTARAPMRQTAAERGEWQSGFHRFTAEGAIAVPFTLRDLASAAQPGRSFESATYLRVGRGLRGSAERCEDSTASSSWMSTGSSSRTRVAARWLSTHGWRWRVSRAGY